MSSNNITVKNNLFHKHVLIEVTKRCNLHCKHCFTSAGKKLDTELTKNEWEAVAKDLCFNNFSAFTISGGEPLLEFTKTALLAKRIRLMNEKAKIYLFTNGLLIRDKHMPVIKTYFNGVGTSIDGNEQTHNWIRDRQNSYQLTVKSIDLLKKNNISVFIQSMVTPQTQPYLNDVVKLAIQKRVEAIRFSHVDFFGRAKSQRQLLGSPSKNLERLNNQVKNFNKMSNIYITTNLVDKKALIKYPNKFRIPSLHILPNGFVLPWYGLPNKFSLWKYPNETLRSLSSSKLSKRIGRFEKLLSVARKKAISCRQEGIDYDNTIALFAR